MRDDDRIISAILFSLFFLLAFCAVLEYSLEYQKLQIDSLKNKTIIFYGDRIVVLPENEKYNSSLQLVMF